MIKWSKFHLTFPKSFWRWVRNPWIVLMIPVVYFAFVVLAAKLVLNVIRPPDQEFVFCLAFSPDGTLLASAGSGGQIHIRDVESGSIVKTLKGSPQAVYGIAFSPDGSSLVSVSYDATVRVWDIFSGKRQTGFKSKDGTTFTSIAFSPDGQSIATGEGPVGMAKVVVWDVATREERMVFPGHPQSVNGLTFTQDGTRLATVGYDGILNLWDMNSQSCVDSIRACGWACNRVAMSPDGNLIATSGNDKLIKLWHLNPLRASLALPGHKNFAESLAFSPNGRLLASVSGGPTDEPGELILWDTITGDLVARWHGHEGFIGCVCFSPDGQSLATGGGWDGAVKLWKVALYIPEEQRKKLSGKQGPTSQ